MKENELKLCPFCESPMVAFDADEKIAEPYLECPTCGLRFKQENFDKAPCEIKAEI